MESHSIFTHSCVNFVQMLQLIQTWRNIMNSIPFSEARAHLTEVVNTVTYKGERFILTKNGKQVAAFISIEDLELLEELEDQLDLRAAKKAKKEKTVPWKDVKEDLGL